MLRQFHIRGIWSVSLGGLMFLAIVSCSGKDVSTPPAQTSLSGPWSSGFEIVEPSISDDVLLNPGKGWILYSRTPQMPGPHPSLSDEVLSITTVGYSRFEWATLNPENGVYDWSPIYDSIDIWTNEQLVRYSKRFAFGVMACNQHTEISGGFVTPYWVFASGAEYQVCDIDGVEIIVPDFEDPVFLMHLNSFLEAMAAQFDGHEDIAFIDIRSYGNWGEGHMWPFHWYYPRDTFYNEISAQSFQDNHVQPHIDNFLNTRLCISVAGHTDHQAVYDWAVQAMGLAARRDGILGNSDGSETARALGYSPAIFEFFSSYQNLVAQQMWDPAALIQCVNNGMPSYIGLGQWGYDPHVFYEDESALIEDLANEIGYHFVLKKAVYPIEIAIQTLPGPTIDLTWQNTGIAYLYEPCIVGLGLFRRNTLQSISWATEAECDPHSWSPSDIAEYNEEAGLRFSSVSPGTYSLGIGLFHDTEDQEPDFLLGIETDMIGKWYILGDIDVVQQ